MFFRCDRTSGINLEWVILLKMNIIQVFQVKSILPHDSGLFRSIECQRVVFKV